MRTIKSYLSGRQFAWLGERKNPDLFEISVPTGKLLVSGATLSAFGFGSAWIFYKSLAISVIFGFFSLFFLKYYIRDYRRKIQEKIENEFYDINLLLSAELETGVPMNLAIESISREVNSSDIYEFAFMNQELQSWKRKMGMGIALDSIFLDFAKRSQRKELIEYAEMIALCTRKGGSLKEVIKNTNSILNEKREIKREIEVLTAEKRLEQKIMNLMPLVVLVMLDRTAPEFIAPLYHNLIGRVTMSVLLLLFLLSYLWSSKISKLD